MVACSGGVDSLALLAATVFEARRKAWHLIGVTVDHGLQDGSAARAAAVVEQMAALGCTETASARVQVQAAGRGIEAGAREARYVVLEELASRMRASVVLLGHTLDDQAETVLLGLTRGSGGRSLGGMRPGFGPFRRPLLEVTRAQTEAACRAEGIAYWEDPHNTDPGFTRARIRHRVLPVLEDELGPGVAVALARTARLARQDAEALDALADQAYARAVAGTDPAERADPGGRASPGGAARPGGRADPSGRAGPGRRACRDHTALDISALLAEPPAIRRRVLRLAALDAGSPAAELFLVHVDALDALVVDWHGQGPLQLPGHVTARRAGGEIRLSRAAGAG
jgi:tRNA(Ile)-lysidine synthase